MANVRIKDLSTTASTTASDDFFGVDGATNGTRKLNAYSPTFGGNLTVSGTGTSSFSGRVRTTSNDGFDAIVSSGNTGLGLGSGSQQYSLYLNAADNSLRIYSSPGGDRLAVSSGGNLLLKSDGVDSGNGKLQLATHTTSAGGIGFGTDTSLYRGSAGELRIDGSANSVIGLNAATGGIAAYRFFVAGTEYARISSTSAGSLFLGTNGATTALTLDSSQAATFAGTATLTTAGASSTGSNSLIYTGQDGNGNVRTVAKIIGKHAGNGGYGNLVLQTAFNNSLVDALTIDSSQNATFAGKITVSGTGNSRFGGPVEFNGAQGADLARFLESGTTKWVVGALTGTGTLDFYSASTGTQLTLGTNYAQFAGTVIANKATTAFRIPTAETPASASATGTIGTITWDASYIYVCTAANTWKRVAIATW